MAAGLCIEEWITPQTLVLSLQGKLDAETVPMLQKHLHQLLKRFQDIIVTLDLASITHVEEETAEDLFLTLIAKRAAMGTLALARPSFVCRPLLRKLNIDCLSAIPQRWMPVGVTE